MKYIKKYENTNIPRVIEVGDWIILQPWTGAENFHIEQFVYNTPCEVTEIERDNIYNKITKIELTYYHKDPADSRNKYWKINFGSDVKTDYRSLKMPNRLIINRFATQEEIDKEELEKLKTKISNKYNL